MYTPPLHRKLVPWFYTALFFVVAPTLIFYTAGYRYNSKKAAIEKRGTLITDSIPSDGKIFLDTQDVRATTPAVFQELTPGEHRIRIEKEGYFPWEKTLELRAERVTFADRVRLWRIAAEPTLLIPGNFSSLKINPDHDTLAALEETASSTELLLIQGKGRVSFEAVVSTTKDTPTSIHWQDDSRALVLDTSSTHDTLVRFVKNVAVSTSTPAQGFWNGADYVAPISSGMWNWSSRNGVSTIESIASSVHAKVDDYLLQQATTGSTQLLFDRTFSSRAFSLPDGMWEFSALLPNAVILHSEDRWLGVNPHETQSFLGLVEGDEPRWLTVNGNPPSALFIHHNELWLWTINTLPVLLLRQSEPVQAATWHTSGDAIFFADKTSVQVLDLDTRDGRAQHPLATFDDIKSIELLGKTLYIAGTKNNQPGLWTLPTE